MGVYAPFLSNLQLSIINHEQPTPHAYCLGEGVKVRARPAAFQLASFVEELNMYIRSARGLLM
jgi:hypothetical protein